MSRIGNKVITIPAGLNVEIVEVYIDIKGKVGEDKVEFDPSIISLELNDGILTVKRANDQKRTKAMHGTTRALIANALKGCSEGFKKNLQVIGIGYRAENKGEDLVLHLGYSHPITIKPLPGVKIVATESKNKNVNAYIEVSGSDKFKVGQVAALIREQRRPEPYKGKGVRYADEVVLRKEGKRAGKK